MSDRVKVRFHTWYWGNYCMAPKNAVLPPGFELYDEEKHGWKNSEEWKVYGKKKPLETGPCTIESVINTTYIRRKSDEYRNTVKHL